MYRSLALASLTAITAISAQQVGTLTAETHPKLSWQKCTSSGCTTQAGSVVLDSNWRWLHTTSGSTNCYTGNKWDATLCADPKVCAQNCALDGADYAGTYGITTSGNALTLKFVTKSSGTNVGSRVYLMNTADTQYEMFKPNNMEFTFDVEVANLPCGLNGALYFSEMAADGGMSQFPTNKAGAKYGTGYCDAQCPHDIKFINGEANVLDWTGSATDVNSGGGRYGACCSEFDVWEANSVSTAYTPHPCNDLGLTRCSGTTCGDGDNRYGGVCDKDGCDINAYRMGNKTFYGVGKTVDTSKKMTVVTQFITTTGTASGTLKEVRRLYVQNGVVINQATVNVPGIDPVNAISDAYCAQQKTVFDNPNDYATKGGMAKQGASFNAGVVLVMSIWDDHAANMLWLDSSFPTTADPNTPGVARGECPTTSGKPSDVEANSPNASVTFSNIKFGTIGSTYSGSNPPVSSVTTGTTTTTRPPTTSTTTTRPPTTTTTTQVPTTTGGTVGKWGQCGGIGYTGPTVCISSTCTKLNDYYYQCL